MIWYEELGFYNNPFSIKPAAFHDELIGYEDQIKKLNNKIATGNICLLIGEYGSGKTTMFQRIINKFRGEKKVIYYSCNQKQKTISFDKLLYEKTWFNKLFRIKPKDMILLLDEAQELNWKEQEVLLEYYEKGYFQSIALVTKSKKELKLIKKLAKTIGKNIYEFKKVTPEQAVKIVRKRIGNIKILSNLMIKKIYKLKSNPRALMENCEDACKHAVERGSTKVEDNDIKAIK